MKGEKEQKDRKKERRSSRSGVLEASLRGIGRAGLKKLARKAGVRRMEGGDFLDNVREAGMGFIYEVVKHSITYAEYNNRVTIMLPDVLQALKTIGRPIYGYGN